MATSIAPFLYQTRTIRAAIRQRVLTLEICHNRPFSAYPIRFAAPGPTNARRRTRRPPQPLPDVLSGIEPESDGLLGSQFRDARVRPRPDSADDDLIPFQAPAEARAHAPSSTITDKEMAVFSSIFEEIRVLRPHLVTPSQGAETAIGLSASEPHKAAATPSTAKQRAVSPRPKRATKSSKQPATVADPAQNATDALDRFPNALRPAAAEALKQSSSNAPDLELACLDLLDGLDAENSYAGSDTHQSDYKAIRQDVREITDAMANCETDTQLWALLEDRVFSLVTHMTQSPKATKPSWLVEEEKADGEKVKVESAANEAEENYALHRLSQRWRRKPPAFVWDWKTNAAAVRRYGPVYSTLLPRALRQLAHGFRPASPLAFDLLPRVRELGMTSAVVGASATLYLEVMEMHWARRSDLRAVFALLDELEAGGLSFTPDILRFLTRLGQIIQVCESDQGGFLSAIMVTPSFDGEMRMKLFQWQDKVKSALDEAS